jgi:eukaryotic-like serine/threonine-protein kinase
VRPQTLKASEPILGYTVTERIGAGGYGEVWKADAPGGLTKAIKFVYGFLDDDRASRELKALNRIKQVRHPFLLSLERIEVVDGQLIIVTELADMSLKDRHEECKAAGLVGIPRSELLTYMHDAADALDYMRESFSLQHLDVKPENLLLVGGRVKVADFGLVKDIHDKTASLMGGLTPVYAPPEVFDDRPSHYSDQYSLAIVYQELLTDVLPFPGRTAAQLAAQHLQSRPRLGPLPPSDQPVIARSLSKEPDKRYPSCRAMVDALIELGGAPPAHRSTGSGGATEAVETDADTASAALCATLPSMRPPAAAPSDNSPAQRPPGGLEARQAAQPQPNSQPCLTEVRDPQRSKRKSTTVLPARLSTPRPRPAPVVTELPPISVPDTAAALRPTLFLGIGGTGASTLAHLRQRLHDRWGGLDAAPAFGLLLLDTDPKSLHLATQGEEGAALLIPETLALPLRRTEEYRAGSAQLLQWMSRRWLYNIPRSLQTEGLRPLGRLALVDHAPELFKRLHAALAAITSAEALEITAHRTGLSFADVTPRVFVIASIAGGTGSGMVLDTAYAVRKVLADLGQPADSVYGVLTHSTGRKAATRDLAIANSYACLSELRHYSSVSPFPGEPACGLPAAAEGDTTFAQTYLLDLGEDLTESEFRTATGAVAEYLFLNAATPSSKFFDQCRSLAVSEKPADEGPLVRSFGICRLGCSRETPTAAANILCRSLLERWSGESRRARVDAARRLADLPGVQAAPEPAPTGFLKDLEIDRLAADHAAALNLDVDHVIMELYDAVERELGSDAETYVCRVVASLAAGQGLPTAATDAAPGNTQVLSEINVLLGCQTAEEDLGRPPTASLQTVLDDHLRKLAAGYGAAIRDWVLEQVDVTGIRVRGAHRATEWFAGHLRSMKQLAGEMLAHTQEDAAIKQEEILESKIRNCLREGRDGKPALDPRFQQYTRLRFLEIALTGVRRLAQLASSHVSSAGDVLKEARRELSRLAEEFPDDMDLPTPESVAGDTLQAADAITATIGANLAGLLPELAAQLDQQLQVQFVADNGGLCAVLSKMSELRRPLLRSLRFAARAAVLARLEHMSAAKEILEPGVGDAEERFALLRTSLASAVPRLLSCGGAKRLLLATSDESVAGPLKEILHNELHEQASLAPGSPGDVTLCYEVEQVPLEVAAVTLVEENSEYAQIAARLHTRVDVAWQPLAKPGDDTLQAN